MKKIDKEYIKRHIVRYANRIQTEEERMYLHNSCAEAFKKRLERNNIPAEEPAPGEEEYIKFWQQFCERVEPYTYRFFSRIVGPNPHIVPEDIANLYIESHLNPEKFRSFYSDKNMYSRYIKPASSVPYSYIFRVNGGLMMSGDDYFDFNISSKEVAKIIGDNVQKVVIKPTTDTYGGAKILLFKRENDAFVHDKIELSGSYLKSYGKNFAIQEVVEQHPFMNQFCKTSCNTMRIMTYRSIVDESVSVFGAIQRIGGEGSFVDNITSGGGYIPIDVESGKFGKCAYDHWARPTDSIHNVSFNDKEYVLPYWKQAADFAKSIANQVVHQRLLAQDIVIDKDGNPRLIEFNVGGFWWGASMYSGRIPLGDKFDEVIEYCLKHKNEIDK